MRTKILRGFPMAIAVAATLSATTRVAFAQPTEQSVEEAAPTATQIPNLSAPPTTTPVVSAPVVSAPALSAPTPTVATALPPPMPPAAAPVVDAPSPLTGRLYGYIESQFHTLGSEPNGNVNANGTAMRAPVSADIGIPHFNVMGQGSIYSRFRWYFNLSAPDSDAPTFDVPIGLRNAWLEASIFGDLLSVRVGKMYRRFGYYNEIIDTVPSFVGVETPVYISGDRPMLTRTTNAMLHGKVSYKASTVSYSLTAGKDEQSTDDHIWSPGLDVNWSYNATLLLGTSYYNSGGKVIPSVALGAGDSAGGVAPWMKQDSFQVYGGYGRLSLGSFFVHVEAWVSPHQAERDPTKVLELAQNATNFSAANRARMGVSGATPTADQVITGVNYTYTGMDVRAAYTFDLGTDDWPVELTPYVDFDYVRNLESISDLNYGGDGQPGESPRGIMMHERIGAVFKPVPQVAMKAEGTYAMYDYGDHYASDPELWLSLSYQWELFHK